uniref:Uncharacterized protein n=1 Tax=Anguilla anguilla TaxID=7936 RepID=A0A0E9UWG4_ANGAN
MLEAFVFKSDSKIQSSKLSKHTLAALQI